MTSSGNILDSAEVDFLIQGANPAAPPPEAGQGQPGSEAAVTMRGDLDQINLSDIFQTLALTKMEGVLRVLNPLEQRQVFCKDGYVRILVPPRISTRRLGQRLVKAGLIQPEQLRATLLKQRKDQTPIGALLVADGHVTQEQVDEVAGMQVAEDLFSLFTWRHGTFEFYKGPVADPELQKRFDGCPEFEVSSLLIEVARRADEWESILKEIGSLDEVPAHVAEAPMPGDPDEVQRSLLFGADGRLSYRQLAEQTTSGLFDVARIARDLVREGCLANISDEDLMTVAEGQVDASQTKQALMLLQTLRDRSGTRSIPILNRMVAVLDKAGERRFAGSMVLELAQHQTDPAEALPLARRARELAPNDPTTIAFLRTTLLAQSVTGTELDRCTVDLLDALIGSDKSDAALELIAELRRTPPVAPQVLMREARARQKTNDVPGAVNVLFELGETYRAQGEKKGAIDAYEGVLRLDRTRKDVEKLVRQMRQTRTDRLVRAGAVVFVVLLLSTTGIVFWQQSYLDGAMRTAGEEIGELLKNGDRAGARECLRRWTDTIGDTEAIDDLRRQVDFADASELTRLTKLAHKRLHDRLAQAADTLNDGDLKGAMQVYDELARLPDFRSEVSEVATTRLQAVLVLIDQAAKAMTSRLPPEPSSLLDRRDLIAYSDDLRTMCPPSLFRVVDELRTLGDSGALPSYLSAEATAELTAVVARTKGVFERAKELSLAYAAALQRNETQRQLDPMFKEAKRLEEAFDFAGALLLYRQIDKAEASDGVLRAHFRERVARNETICAGIEAIKKATETGDHAGAQQHYRRLRKAYGDVPFDRIVRLPLVVESLPAGAIVHCNGAQVGKTPCTLAFVPADSNQLTLSLPGFQPETTTVTGDESLRLWVNMLLTPRFVRQQDNLVDAAPASDANGTLYFADRGGVITALDRGDGHERWTQRTGDLSGLLSQPFVHDEHVVAASLDGELRAFERATGRVAWSIPSLPTEVAPVLIDDQLAIATTGRRLVVVNLDTRAMVSADLPATPRGRLFAHGSTILCCVDGEVVAHVLPTLARSWRRPLPAFGEASGTLTKGALVLVDDRGHVTALDPRTGVPSWQRQVEDETRGPAIEVGGDMLVGSRSKILRFATAAGTDGTPISMGNEELAGPPRRVGKRLLCPLRSGFVQVLDLDSGQPLYRFEGHKRGVELLVADGAVAAVLPDRRILFYGALR